MPIYKDIWYADANTPLNPSAISAAEATSTGNKLESVASQLPIKVSNATARDELYPNPVQGDAVYRLDLGKEERYYETYSIKDNIGGKPYAGWYLVNSGQNLVNNDDLYSYTLDGTTSSFSTNLLINENMNFLRIAYNFHSVTNASSTTLSSGFLRFRFFFSGSEASTANYVLTQIGNNSGTPVSRTVTTDHIPLWYETFGQPAVFSGNILISGIRSDSYGNDYPKIISQMGSTSTNSGVAQTSGYWNSPFAGSVFSGFKLYASSNNLRGNVSFRTYN